ncbi:MAG TPA: fibronectin type III domain-containing protein [Anaeromyxobacteraceae bacterium]|nr:fibronectin type III domain-containing protein [Anaeromyxobacteraceae bacterium]
MTRRAALLALLATPALASAQAGIITFAPDTYVNLADCAGDTITLDWTVLLESGAVLNPAWTYKIYASGTAPNGTPASCADTAGQVGGDITPVSLAESVERSASDIVGAAGFSCGTVTEPTIYVCAHLLDAGSVKQGSATGSLKLQLLKPAVPSAPTVTPGDTCLYVSWTEVKATSTTAAAAKYRVEVSTTDPEDPVTHSDTTSETHTTICGLLNKNLAGNAVIYTVRVIAISAGGNESDRSPSTQGDPIASDDFWTHYKKQGGQEEGGCSTGGAAGLLALLGALALRAAGRRRS